MFRIFLFTAIGAFAIVLVGHPFHISGQSSDEQPANGREAKDQESDFKVGETPTQLPGGETWKQCAHLFSALWLKQSDKIIGLKRENWKNEAHRVSHSDVVEDNDKLSDDAANEIKALLEGIGSPYIRNQNGKKGELVSTWEVRGVRVVDDAMNLVIEATRPESNEKKELIFKIAKRENSEAKWKSQIFMWHYAYASNGGFVPNWDDSDNVMPYDFAMRLLMRFDFKGELNALWSTSAIASLIGAAAGHYSHAVANGYDIFFDINPIPYREKTFFAGQHAILRKAETEGIVDRNTITKVLCLIYEWPLPEKDLEWVTDSYLPPDLAKERKEKASQENYIGPLDPATAQLPEFKKRFMARVEENLKAKGKSLYKKSDG